MFAVALCSSTHHNATANTLKRCVLEQYHFYKYFKAGKLEVHTTLRLSVNTGCAQENDSTIRKKVRNSHIDSEGRQQSQQNPHYNGIFFLCPNL